MKALLAILALTGCATTVAAVDPAEERGFYQKVVERLRGSTPIDPSQVDYDRLRQAARFEREGTDLTTVARTLVAARAVGDHARAVAAADALLASDYTDVEAHLEKARSLHRGDARRAAFHESLALGLLQSILATRDSRTGALRVFGPREEHAVATFLDLRPIHRASRREGDRHIDLLDCYDRRNRRIELRFDVTPPTLKPESKPADARPAP